MLASNKYNRGLRFEQFTIGDQFATASRTIRDSDIWAFSCLTGDWNPLHTDEEYCRTQQFKTRIAHGLLIVSIGTGLASQLLIFEGTSMGLLEARSSFLTAVKPGDTIRTIVKVIDKKEIQKYHDRGIITYECDILNQLNEKVVEMRWVVMIRKQGDG
jgi:acyl dehydratase